MFGSGGELLRICEAKRIGISEAAIEDEMQNSGRSREEITGRMRIRLEVMKKAASAGLQTEIKSLSGIIGKDAEKVNTRNESSNTLCGGAINRAMARALSGSAVNASMGRIVAAPTAGSCGILPAVVITAAEVFGATEDELLDSLFTASAIGEIIAHNATISGAEGGCQAECGSASAMAAASAVQLGKGTPSMCLNAGAIVIKSVLGLVCDPVAGLVASPCAKRNAMGAVEAMAAADMALAGVESVIPFDEVVDAMYRVGRAMPCELRETALGGLATTPTALEIQKRIFGK